MARPSRATRSASRSAGSRWPGPTTWPPARSCPATTSAATWRCGATSRARPTSTTPSAPTWAPTSATAATSTATELVCPFHGWQFDADGTNTLIPYGNRVNQRARIRSYPVIEIDQFVMAWYHPHDAEPTYQLEPPAELDDPDYSEWTNVVFRVGGRLPGDGRELGGRPPLPLRAQHRHRARDPELRRPRARARGCARCRSSRRRAAWWTVASTSTTRARASPPPASAASSTRC